MARYDNTARTHYYIAETRDGDCIGCVRWVRMGTNTGKFGRLAVAANHRGSGIAIALMLFMEQHANKYFSITRLYCNSQCDKKGFYQKLGYVEQGEEFIDGDDQGVGGTLHIEMGKFL